MADDDYEWDPDVDADGDRGYPEEVRPPDLVAVRRPPGGLEFHSGPANQWHRLTPDERFSVCGLWAHAPSLERASLSRTDPEDRCGVCWVSSPALPLLKMEHSQPLRCRGCGQVFPGSRDVMMVRGQVEHIACYDPAWDEG